MHKLLTLLFFFAPLMASAANPYDNPDTLFVAQDGSAPFHTIADAVEVCRAFMDYHKVIFIKKGTYHEKLIIPSWLTNIELCGEDRDATIITWSDHANMPIPGTNQKMGTFRTFTVRVDGNAITLKNLTIENNAPRLGQAVALHTQGSHLVFRNCRFLGNQDTVYTGGIGTSLLFDHCYIEGTTDFIFGPSEAWFQNCILYSKINSYITAASTPKGQARGYVFDHCTLTAAPGVTQCYLGRPWRPYAKTVFQYCDMGAHIRPEGWYNWNDPRNEKTAFYAEYKNTGKGYQPQSRVSWSHQLTGPVN